MANWKVYYIAIVLATFLVSLAWISFLPKEVMLEEDELDIVLFSEEEWDNFVERRKIELPDLGTSLDLWEKVNETTFLELRPDFPALVQYPLLPYDENVTCLPRKFGYTQEQADSLFNPNRKYPQCGNPKSSSLLLSNNLDCTAQQLAEYVLGQGPADEKLGDIDFKGEWKKYEDPIDLGTAEYAFGRCSKSKKEAILVNKFNVTAAERAQRISKEIRQRLNITREERPLAVYLLLFDSVSRQHFYRSFPQTIDYLNKHLETGKYKEKFLLYDFVVNNAHGENTQPNMVPFLYGYNLKYHRSRLQGFSIHRPEDAWKYLDLQEEALWKVFEHHGFVTLFAFDTVWDFLSHSTGRTVATDHVLSNFYHACRKLFGYMDFVERQRCIGLHNAHFYALDYLYQYNRNYKGLNRFAYLHLSPGHEKSGTVIRTADYDMMLFLESILDEQKTRKNEDFVLMFASDHGKHSSEWDKLYEGFLENQLPLHLVIANKGLIERLGPDTHEILSLNTKRLVTRLDWHLTFRHLATLPYGRLRADSPLYNTWKQQTDSLSSLSVFLERIPDSRNCAEMDIPLYYCSCSEFTELTLEEAESMQPVEDLIDVSRLFSWGSDI